MMGPKLLVVSALIYVVVAHDYYKLGAKGAMVAWIAYAVANLGFMWDLLSRRP